MEAHGSGALRTDEMAFSPRSHHYHQSSGALRTEVLGALGTDGDGDDG